MKKKVEKMPCPECSGKGSMPDVTDHGLPRKGKCWRCKGEGTVAKSEIVKVYSSSGDWEGIYVNGELRMENHGISDDDLLRAIGTNMMEILSKAGYTYRSVEAKEEWLEDRGCLPKDLKECKLARGV